MTFVSFPDLEVTSANGRYRVEVCGRSSSDSFRDQSHFKYRLHDQRGLMWEKSPRDSGDEGDLDDYPHEAWVSDDGWVVIRTHTWFHAGLMVFSPAGEVVLRQQHRKLLDDDTPGFLDDEPAEYLGDSSAGPFWSRCSIAYFCTLRQRPCWAIRTWWGKRVVIDLEQAEVIEPCEADELLLTMEESTHIQHTLSQANSLRKQIVLDESKDICARYSQQLSILTAAYHAGWLRVADCIPQLRKLERVDATGSQCYGPVSWASVIELPFRHVAKTSLLRMGQEPNWLAHYQFETHQRTARERRLYEFPVRVESRDPSLLVPGLSQQQVLQHLGAPEFIQRQTWEYDFLSGESASTVRVWWDDSHLQSLPLEERKTARRAHPPRLQRVEFVEPQWEQISRRDYDLTH